MEFQFFSSVLTTLITPICIISCINSIKVRVKEFLIAILILETFMIGVFCSLDLVVFYIFFEAGINSNVFNYWCMGWSTKSVFSF
jgi:NADH:ubiquinone oxidoreductase subunit 4 (subunit M)